MATSAHRIGRSVSCRGDGCRFDTTRPLVLCAQDAMVSTTRLVVWPGVDYYFYMLRNRGCLGLASRPNRRTTTFGHRAVCVERGLQCALEHAVFLSATTGLGAVGSGFFVGVHPVADRVFLVMVASFGTPADAVSRVGNVRIRAEYCNRALERAVFRTWLA